VLRNFPGCFFQGQNIALAGDADDLPDAEGPERQQLAFIRYFEASGHERMIVPFESIEADEDTDPQLVRGNAIFFIVRFGHGHVCSFGMFS